VLAGLLVLPLMPTLAAGPPADDTPAKGGDGAARTADLVLSSKDCAACHQPAKKPEKETGDLHGRIVKLLDEMQKQRAQLKKTEAALKEALDRFEGTAPKGKAASPSARERQLEERLQKLTKELDSLRREVRRRDAGFGRDGRRITAGQKHYTFKRQITIPIDWKEGSGVKQMGLFVKKGPEGKYELVRMVPAGTKLVNYTAPKDGTYSFYLFLPAGEGAPRVRETPAATLTVVVDTKPPLLVVEWSGGTGAKPLSVKWEVTDEGPLDNNVKLEVRKVNQTAWIDRTADRAPTGITLLHEKEIAEFRLTAHDKAGNRAVVRKWVNRDDSE
jgi:hypothetical protein